MPKSPQQPCPGVKHSECRFTEDQFVRANKGDEAYLRRFYRAKVAEGIIPPTCEACGCAHWPLVTESAA